MTLSDKLNILNLSVSTNEGGAAIAALRLHKTFMDMGYSSHLLTLRGSRDNLLDNVISVSKNRFLEKLTQFFDSIPTRMYQRRERGPWGNGFFGNLKINQVQKRTFNVIILYWIDSGFISLAVLRKIINLPNTRVIIRLSDQWIFTGGCHYSGDCVRFQDGCGYCPKLNSLLKLDLSYINLKRKTSINFSTVEIACPSNWIADKARSSVVLSQSKFKTVKTGVDLNIYTPIGRKQTDLNPAEITLAFGAVNYKDDKRKGFEKINATLSRLQKDKTRKYSIDIFGNNKADFHHFANKIKIRYHGNINDDTTMAKIYKNADIFICPSLEENLANTAVESIACGTPVICLDIGGMRDAVIDGKTGQVCDASDDDEIFRAINEIVKDPLTYQRYRDECRVYAINEFDRFKVAKKILEPSL